MNMRKLPGLPALLALGCAFGAECAADAVPALAETGASQVRFDGGAAKGEKWYGGNMNDGARQPVAGAFDDSNLATNEVAAPLSPFRVSTEGRYVAADGSVAASADRTLRGAHLAAMKEAIGIPGAVPPREFFEKPQFNNWMEMVTDGFSQAKTEAYLEGIRTNGYPCGVFTLDAGYQTSHGATAFKSDAFPDPKGLFRKAHAVADRAMLWTMGMLRSDTGDAKTYARYLVQDPEGRPWFLPPAKPESPVYYFWDFTNPAAVDVYVARMKAFAAEYGFDGFKFDGGHPFRMARRGGFRLHDGSLGAGGWPHGYAGLARRFPYNEFCCGFGSVGAPVVMRVHDLSHRWGHLKKMSHDVQLAGLMGYPFVFADMIGGGQEGDWKKPGFRLDEKLFVRMAAMQALQPMMQFSLAPWRVLSAEGNAACLGFAKLHVAYAPKILALAENAAKTGEPIVRTMEYVFPHQGFARPMTQFMLGDDLLVAPVCDPDDSVTVELPAGRWTDDLGEEHVGPKTVRLDKVPLTRLPRYRREKFVP